MLQDMEAICIFCVKVRTFVQLEPSKICRLTVIPFGIVMLTLRHDLMVSVCFMYGSGDVFRESSPDILSVEEFPCEDYHACDFSCRSLRCIPANKDTTSAQLTANHGTVGIPCHL